MFHRKVLPVDLSVWNAKLLCSGLTEIYQSGPEKASLLALAYALNMCVYISIHMFDTLNSVLFYHTSF